MKQQQFKIGATLMGAAIAWTIAGATTVSAQAIRIDGSSTVYPISAAVAEEFGEKNKDVKVTVGISGTGGGFKKFAAGEIDISDASRPIKATEAAAAAKNNIEYIELPVAYDALTVVVNPANTWCTSLTRAELKKIWEPGSKVNNWKDVREGFPDKALKLFGPGTDSGTFDYFTEAINGKEKASRSDFTASEDDNVLVEGVANDTGALGYFGYAYYEENQKKLRAVSIDNGKGAVAPSPATVNNGTYQPLARPLFIYVNKASVAQPHVANFVRFYLANCAKLSGEVGYVALPANIGRLAVQRYNRKATGSIFGNQGATVGLTLAELLRLEKK